MFIRSPFLACLSNLTPVPLVLDGANFLTHAKFTFIGKPEMFNPCQERKKLEAVSVHALGNLEGKRH
jgi:predicted NAD-dependent protein-ADP-ribosyltransferase YbiA (DUF1768 family)